uniref:hypothetical protein n=1 Tax=Nocardioides sp. TaxID=35761 RepID=UPI00286DA292
ALRLLGAGLVALSVVLAGRIGALAVPRGHASIWTPILTAGTAALFLVNPLFGAMEINGELIAVTLVLLSTERVLHARAATTPRSATWILFTAGAAAAAAVLVKQNEVDALVLTAVLAIGTARHRGVAFAGREVAAVVAGAVVCVSLVLAHALTLGTTLPGLWEAVVTFRIDASAVINSSASPATSARLVNVLASLAISGAPAIVVLFALRLRRRAAPGGMDLRPPALALLGWESVSVVAGGSYWLHYLLVLLPGLVLAVAAVCASTSKAVDVPPVRSPRPVPASLLAVLGYATVASLVAIGVLGARPSTFGGGDLVASWLSAHTRRGDTAVIAYGHPNILQASGLSSPYPELWSLPVKVRDPHLAELTSLLASSSRPDWVVTTGAGLDAWGIDASTASAALSAHYGDVAVVDGSHVFHQLTPLNAATDAAPVP